jgi:hypothetical protein
MKNKAPEVKKPIAIYRGRGLTSRAGQILSGGAKQAP